MVKIKAVVQIVVVALSAREAFLRQRSFSMLLSNHVVPLPGAVVEEVVVI